MSKTTNFIGPKEYFKVFKMLGFNCVEANSEKEAIQKIEKLKKNEKTGLIFASRDILDREMKGVTIIPGLVNDSKSNYLEEKIKKAIGSENISLSK